MTSYKNRSSYILVLIIIVGLLLSACGNSNGDTNTGQSSGNSNSNTEQVDTQKPTQSPDVNESPEDNETQSETKQTTQTIVDAMLSKIEQPSLMDVPSDMVADLYHLDTAMLEDYTIKIPMMNVKTNEIAILQVKDANDIPTIEEAVKLRAEDVQKQFETYLPDQYENAKNYKLIVKDNYVLFFISERAEDLVNEFNSFFE